MDLEPRCVSLEREIGLFAMDHLDLVAVAPGIALSVLGPG